MVEGEAAEARSEAEELFFQFLARKRAGSTQTIEDFAAGYPAQAELLLQLHRSFLDMKRLLATQTGLRGGQVSLDSLLKDLGEEPLLSEEPRAAEEPPPTMATMLLQVEGGQPARPEELEALLVRLGGWTSPAQRYRMESEIGRGGMGVVRRVWDEELRRFLAMKVMGLAGDERRESPVDPDSLRRFLDEALVTGQLDHPGIVPVHELGVDASGQPFFTMKLVKGTTLKTILDQLHAGEGGWTVNRVVGVIQRVCEAVAYAHSKRVIHRDIKPANIMVGRFGETYLMDWGLARLLPAAPAMAAAPVAVGAAEAAENAPAVGASLAADPAEAPPSTRAALDDTPDSWLFDPKLQGTPPYMSPEQASGDIAHVDERSDIYSLGALLYHMLTGCMPYANASMPFEVIMRLRREPPRPVLELAPEAAPTLVAICERAMSRSIEQRYASAATMAAELQDYLEDISEAREEARRQARRANMINTFLTDMLVSGDPAAARGREVTVREVLDRAAAGIEGGLPGLAADEAALRLTIGRLYLEMGQFGQAEPHLLRAHALQRELLGDGHVETLSSATDLGLLLHRLGRTAEAGPLLRATLDSQERLLGGDHRDTLRTADILASVLHRHQVDFEEVERLRRHVWERREATLGDGHSATYEALNELARLMLERGEYAKAVTLHRKAHAALLALHGENHPATLIALNDLANALALDGRHDEAEPLYRRLILLQRQVQGPRHLSTLVAMNNLGTFLRKLGRLDEAGTLLAESLEIQRADRGENHPHTLSFVNNLALLLMDRGQFAEAQRQLEDCVARAEALFTSAHRHTARYRLNLGLCLARSGQRARGRATLIEARDALQLVFGRDGAWVKEAQAALDALDAEGGPPSPEAAAGAD